jgi:hypothetical protein
MVVNIITVTFIKSESAFGLFLRYNNAVFCNSMFITDINIIINERQQWVSFVSFVVTCNLYLKI